jgi:hypothetical protein
MTRQWPTLSPEARALIEAGRAADEPSPEARVRGDAAVRVALAMQGMTDLPPLEPPAGIVPSTTVSTTVSTTAGSGVGVKLALGASAAALVTASLFAVYAPARAPAPAPARPAKVATSTEAAQQPISLDDVVRVSERERQREQVAPVQPRTRARAARRGPLAIDAEVRLIAAADDLVRAQRFEDALRVLDGHARRFPRGALREERRALGLLALCGATPGPRARQRSAEFLRSAPRSVLASRVRAACTSTAGAAP